MEAVMRAGSIYLHQLLFRPQLVSHVSPPHHSLPLFLPPPRGVPLPLLLPPTLHPPRAAPLPAFLVESNKPHGQRGYHQYDPYESHYPRPMV